MNKIVLEFNPDYMIVRDVKSAAQILRDLIRKRKWIEENIIGSPETKERAFLNSFDTITQNWEVS